MKRKPITIGARIAHLESELRGLNAVMGCISHQLVQLRADLAAHYSRLPTWPPYPKITVTDRTYGSGPTYG